MLSLRGFQPLGPPAFYFTLARVWISSPPLFALLILALLIFPLRLVIAQEPVSFKVRVATDGGLPVPSVILMGTHGVGIRVSGSDGEIKLPPGSANIRVALGSHNYLLTPASFKVNLANCPNALCQVKAELGGGTAIIAHSIVNSAGSAVVDIPVNLLAAESTCLEPEFSDTDGLVLFGVRRHSAPCNSSDGIVANDPYTILPINPSGRSCS